MIQEQVAGKVGTAVMAGTGFVGFVASAIPVLQALSLAVSILVGAATLVWYVIRIRRGK